MEKIAHLTIATEEEMKGIKKQDIPFLGKSISFSLLNINQVQPEKSWIGSRAYLLVVNCPEAEQIRKKLGLIPKIKGYDFHITIAVDCSNS